MNRKELLTENARALTFLHDAMRFDFERPCVIIKGEGRFTFNSVKKAIADHIEGKYVAAVLIKRNRPYMSDRDLYFVRVGSARFDVERTYKYKHNRSIDSFYGVGDFEECRKAQTDHYYIVAQNVEHLQPTPQKGEGIDLAQRFRYIPHRYEKKGDGRGNTYIGELHLMMLDGSAHEFKYEPCGGFYRHDEKKPATVAEVIDKSGYLVIERRRDLKRRAEKLRADRAAAAARMADFSQQEMAIADRLEAVKGEMAAKVLDCSTLDSADKIEKAARALRWVLYYLEQYNAWREAGRFSSVERVETALNDIAARLDEANAALQ